MAKPRLLLHVGSHKTGTTTIQDALAGNRPWLEDHGVYYPNPKPYFFAKSDAHHDLAHALAAPGGPDSARVRKFRDHLVEAARHHDRILLSAEPFFRHEIPSEEHGREARLAKRRAYIARMADFFAPFDTEILLVLRRPDSFVESLYKNAVVSSPYTGGFDHYIRRGYFRLDYPTRIELFRERFPTITLRSYESGLKAGIVPAFFDMIGVPAPEIADDAHLRRSLTNKATLWLDRSQAGGRLGKRDLNRRWHFALVPASEPVFGTKDRSGLWSSTESRDRFLRRSLGAMPTDFFPPVAELPPQATFTDAEHAAADDAFRAWERANLGYLRRRELLRVSPYRMDMPSSGDALRQWIASFRARAWPEPSE